MTFGRTSAGSVPHAENSILRTFFSQKATFLGVSTAEINGFSTVFQRKSRRGSPPRGMDPPRQGRRGNRFRRLRPYEHRGKAALRACCDDGLGLQERLVDSVVYTPPTEKPGG